MEIEVWSVGKTKFAADPEFQEPMIREAVDQRGDVASVIIDYTDSERNDITYDEYARVTGDTGLVLVTHGENYLTGGQIDPGDQAWLGGTLEPRPSREADSGDEGVGGCKCGSPTCRRSAPYNYPEDEL